MKFLRVKSLLCLLLIAALLVGVLAGCQAPEDTTDAVNHTSKNTEEPSGTTDWGVVIDPTLFTGWLDESPNDPYFQVGLPWSAETINLPDAWDITTGSPTIRVGIIDSGIDASHPDLQNRINEDLSESFFGGVSPLEDPWGHGTHVAGIIGAQGNNEIGVAGVSWNIELVSLRVLGDPDDSQNLSDLVEAMTAAIRSANEKEIDILNISMGIDSSAFNDEFESAIAAFGGLVVCSAGNSDYANANSANNDLWGHYPSNLPMGNLISVGASTHADTLYNRSHFGANTVDLFAPGTAILGCYPKKLCEKVDCSVETHNAIGYHSLSGTSMAAPHVTGVAALLLSIHPELTAAELKQAILNSVDVIYDEYGNSVFGNLCVSGGRLNAYKALTSASIHNFSLWINVNSLYHSRTCSTCGYTESGMHFDSWDSTRGMCTICRRRDPIETPIQSILPLLPEEVEATCESDCA